MAAIVSYSATALERLAQRVNTVTRRGGVIAIPTETYYALGVDPFDRAAVERLRAAKGRQEGKPILVLIGSADQLALVTQESSAVASVLIDAFWPGALTIVLPAHPSLPSNLTAGTGMVGVRLSSSQPLRELLKLVGPLTGTSANRAGIPPAQTAEAVQAMLQDEVELIVDAGPTPGGLPSTVIAAQDPPRLLREGAIERGAIEAILRARGISLNLS